jgi:hypothetical protein
VKFPRVALLPVVTLRIEVAVASGKGVIALGSEKVVSSGAALNQETNSKTLELNPFRDSTVIVAAPLAP